MSLVVQTLSEQIFTLVRDRIISGRLPSDTPIRQDALAAELGVSKIPLREALARLSPSRAAAEVAERLGIPRKRAYARALDLSK